jgi:imidazolonepropionase-like amidohydrolase
LNAIRAGFLIDGTGREPVKDAVVLFDGGRIAEIGPASQVKIPRDVEVMDASDMVVMPGMFDCHCHVGASTIDLTKRLFSTKTLEILKTADILKRTLHAGFTTVRDASGPEDVGFRQAVDAGVIEGPRLILAGAIAQTGGHLDGYFPRGIELTFSEGFTEGPEFADGVPGVQAAARRILRKGFDFIKVCTSGGITSPADLPEYTEWTPEELRAIVYEASARGKAVMAHAEGAQGIKNAIRAGVWSVEHGSMLDAEGIKMLVESGTYFVPTLLIMDELAHNGDKFGLTDMAMSKIERVTKVHFDSFRKAAQAGVKIATGTDIIDDSIHGKNARELELMVKFGFTPMQAIVAATRTAAKVCRLSELVGTLEVGKLADMLVVDGNPLEDISILQDGSRFKLIMKAGNVCVNKL